jgi:hypothetical protein
VWSVKSGKTRVFWNKCNISQYFREGNRSGMVEFSWKSQFSDSLQIVAHSSAAPGVDQQYDLLVDGISFFRLSTLSEIGKDNTARKVSQDENASRSGHLPENGKENIARKFPQDNIASPSDVNTVSPLSDLECWKHGNDQQFPEAMDYRLSMVGLSSGRDFQMVDELHSELYSTSLENVRCGVTECLPQTEEMLSRAIMDTFIATDDSFEDSISTFFSDSSLEEYASQIEANALWEASEWTALNVDYARCQDAEERALVVMQRNITSVIRRIRDEELSSDAAISFLLSVAAVLGLKFAAPIPRDTIILLGLPSGTSNQYLREALAGFGSVDAAAVAKGTDGFAYCRFADGQSPLSVHDAMKNDLLLIEGVKPTIYILSEKTGLEIASHHLEFARAVKEDNKTTQENKLGEPAFVSSDCSKSPNHEHTPSDAPSLDIDRVDCSGTNFVSSRPYAQRAPSLDFDLVNCGDTDLVSPRAVMSMLDFSHLVDGKFCMG